MRTRRTLLLCLAMVMTAAHARAQGVPSAGAPNRQSQDAERPSSIDDPRWSAWLGCWTLTAGRVDAGTQVCIVPAEDRHGVRLLTFVGDTRTSAETVVADGTARPAGDTDCAGERSTRWALKGALRYSSSALRCPGQPELKTSGIAALIAPDRWIDVQVVDNAGRQQVRTRRFWRSSAAPPVPVAQVVAALPPVRERPAPATADDVIEASTRVPPAGVEAWLAEANVRVPVDRRTLLQLADAHVSAEVIDLMVALAFPKKFEVLRTSSSGGGGGFGVGALDWFPGAEWLPLAEVYGLGYGCFGSPYCFGYSGFYPGDWYEQPGGGGGGGATPDSHGQVVNGKGYTRVQVREPDRESSRSNGSSESAAGSSPSGSGSASSAGSAGASPAGYSGGGGSSTGLTAVPR